MIGEKDWLPNSRFSTVIHTLMSMIAHPNLDHPINLQAGADFKEGLFVQRAKEHTEKYAKAVEK
jgi:ubiquitin-protein ligase